MNAAKSSRSPGIGQDCITRRGQAQGGLMKRALWVSEVCHAILARQSTRIACGLPPLPRKKQRSSIGVVGGEGRGEGDSKPIPSPLTPTLSPRLSPPDKRSGRRGRGGKPLAARVDHLSRAIGSKTSRRMVRNNSWKPNSSRIPQITGFASGQGHPVTILLPELPSYWESRQLVLVES